MIITRDINTGLVSVKKFVLKNVLLIILSYQVVYISYDVGRTGLTLKRVYLPNSPKHISTNNIN